MESPKEVATGLIDIPFQDESIPEDEVLDAKSFISEGGSYDFAAFLKATANKQSAEDSPVNGIVEKNCAVDWEFVYETRPEVQRMDEAVLSNNLGNVQATFKSEWLDKPESERIDIQNFGLALSSAVELNSVSMVSFLISIGLTPDQFLLDDAFRTHSYDVVKLLLSEHMDINRPWNEWEPPPLGRATVDHELSQWCLEHGADPNRKAEILDITPLSWAVQEASFDTIKLLFDYGGERSINHGQLLHFAVDRQLPDQLEVLQYIVDKGPAINNIMYQNDPMSYAWRKDFGVTTALHRASETGNLAAVQLLLAHYADPWIRDTAGKLAVDVAEKGGHDAIVDLLRPLSVGAETRRCFTDDPINRDARNPIREILEPQKLASVS
ncbi:MAG: hypothetical protein Q9195_009597 [Heterodermia aff. obscurata]